MNKNIIIFLLLILIPISSNANQLLDFITIGDREPIEHPINPMTTSKNSYPDPFPEDQILFTITKENYEEFSENLLTRGQVEMFTKYPETFKMNIYKSRRSCSTFGSLFSY